MCKGGGVAHEVYARVSCIRMGGDCFGRGYSLKLNCLIMCLLTNSSSYFTSHHDLLRPSILCFITIDFQYPIPTPECCMPLVTRLRVGTIHVYIDWVIGMSTRVTMHYRWLRHSIISTWIFVVIILLIPLILFLIQLFNFLLQGSFFLVACLH